MCNSVYAINQYCNVYLFQKKMKADRQQREEIGKYQYNTKHMVQSTSIFSLQWNNIFNNIYEPFYVLAVKWTIYLELAHSYLTSNECNAHLFSQSLLKY